MWFAVLAAILVGQAAGQDGGLDARQVTLSAPVAIVEIDGGKLKGEPLRLAWGDGAFFLRSASRDIYGNELGKNYLIAGTGGQPAATAEEPPWAASYWAWKAGLSAPGLPELRFEIETRQKNKTATGSTGQDFGGAGGGTSNPNRSDPTASQIAKDASSMQRVVTTTIRLKGHVVTEVQNQPVVGGLMFGWAPAPLGALAHVTSRGRLAIIDRRGETLEVPDTSNVLLPAWSPDGTRIAYLQKTGRKKYALMVVEVKRNPSSTSAATRDTVAPRYRAGVV